METKKVTKKKPAKKENPVGKFIFILIIIGVVVAIAYVGKYINNLYNEYVLNNKTPEDKKDVQIYNDVDIY